jgi:molybdopterin-guanine dinucleotide biosynthesis protein A
VPLPDDGYQTLYAIYSQKCLPAIKRLITADKLKITGFYKEMRLKTINQEQIKQFQQDGRLFLNINTPEDLAKLKTEGNSLLLAP